METGERLHVPWPAGALHHVACGHIPIIAAASLKNPISMPCSEQARKLAKAINLDAVRAVREALRYEAMHEEGDADVGETRHLPLLPALMACGPHACETATHMKSCAGANHGLMPLFHGRACPTCFQYQAQCAKKAFNGQGMPAGPSELSVVLCSDEHIALLNGEWRQKPGPTDVLSFPMEQDLGDGCPMRMLGDLVISLDTAQRQADERGCVLFPTPLHGVLYALCMPFSAYVFVGHCRLPTEGSFLLSCICGCTLGRSIAADVPRIDRSI